MVLSTEFLDIRVFERYRERIDDWQAFANALHRPLPICGWANPLRISRERLFEKLRAEGVQLEALPWSSDGFRLVEDFRLGNLWTFHAGLYQVQEEVSMLPVQLMDVQPTDRVLDLCAAPGNKTAQIAVMMKGRGTVVGNDPNVGRLRALRRTVVRLGLTNISMTKMDGTAYPNRAGLFDKILVDAPCSCQGTSRKEPGVLRKTADIKHIRRAAALQRLLLRRAIRLCRPGGRIVYSTCTYAPEENECVVNAMLEECGDMIRLLPAALPHFQTTAGWTSWEGQDFDPSLAHTLRVWPHHNDTGGFFVAVIEKSADAAVMPKIAHAPPTSWSNLGRQEQTDAWQETLRERHGWDPEAVAPYRFFQSNRRIEMVAKEHQPPNVPKIEAIGMFAVRVGNRFPKLSTGAAMLLGERATRHRVTLDAAQRDAYFRREELPLSSAQVEACGEQGYVLVMFDGYVLGVGLFLPDLEVGQGRLRSAFPKAWSNEYRRAHPGTEELTETSATPAGEDLPS